MNRAARLAAAFPNSPTNLANEVRAAIDAAGVILREPGDDGPRAFVVSPALRGSFAWSSEEAERRIWRAFPELTADAVDRAVRHLHSKVMARIQPLIEEVNRRNSWVHGWQEW